MLRLEISKHRIDPGNVAALRLESKFLMLQVPQALTEQSSCREQHERHRGLRDDQRSLCP